jgi:hypothetical protein
MVPIAEETARRIALRISALLTITPAFAGAARVAPSNWGYIPRQHCIRKRGGEPVAALSPDVSDFDSERCMAVPDEYRARADECFRLAKDASTKQERSRHLGSALTLLLAATRHDDALPALPPAPGLVTVPGDQTRGEDSSNDILSQILEAIPRNSTIAFSADQLGVLFSGGGPLGVGTEVSARVEDIARACGCSFSLFQDIATFTKQRIETSEQKIARRSRS